MASGPLGEVFFFRMRGLRALSAGFISVGSKLAIEFVFAWLPVSKVTNFLHVASFDGKACSRGGDEEDATLRGRMSTLGPQRRAANLLLRMTDIARKVCMAVGKDHFGDNDGAQQILRVLRERYAPDEIDSDDQYEPTRQWITT